MPSASWSPPASEDSSSRVMGKLMSSGNRSSSYFEGAVDKLHREEHGLGQPLPLLGSVSAKIEEEGVLPLTCR